MECSKNGASNMSKLIPKGKPTRLKKKRNTTNPMMKFLGNVIE
jgi:hypothetical protein